MFRFLQGLPRFRLTTGSLLREVELRGFLIATLPVIAEGDGCELSIGCPGCPAYTSISKSDKDYST